MFVLGVTTGIGVYPHHWNNAEVIMASCGALSLGGSVIGLLASRLDRSSVYSRQGSVMVARHAASLAWISGVTAMLVFMFAFGMRVLDFIVQLRTGLACDGAGAFGFGSVGLAVVSCLAVATAVRFFLTCEKLLLTVFLWLTLVGLCSFCLMLPAYRWEPFGGPQRTAVPVTLACAATIVLSMAVLLYETFQKRARTTTLHLPLFRFSCGLIAVGVLIVVVYILVAPMKSVSGGFRSNNLMCAACAAGCAISLYLLARRKWQGDLVDACLALAAFGVVSVCVALLPEAPASLPARYPLIFNATIVAFSIVILLTTQIVYRVRRETEVATDLNEGSDCKIVVYHAARMIALLSALGILISAIMSVWPRWPGISVNDDSLSRMLAGTTGMLLLLLSMLRAARHLEKATIGVLSVFSMICLLMFVLVRVLPFVDRIG